MLVASDVGKVRQYVATSLTRFGATSADSPRESLLIQNGAYCGRRFEASGYEAIWFIEEDEMKFFGPQGDLLLAESVATSLRRQADVQPERRAA